MLLLSTYKILLKIYCKDDDIMIVTPMSNRASSDLENIIGCFVNPVILRTKFSKNSTFLEILNDLKNNTLDAYDHQDVPISLVIENINKNTEYSDYFFQFHFEYHTSNNFKLNIDNLDSRSLSIGEFSSQFNKSLNYLTPYINLEFEYSEDLFFERTILDIAKNYLDILYQVLDDDIYIKDIELKIMPSTSEKYTDISFKNNYINLNNSQPEIDALQLNKIIDKVNNMFKLTIKEVV